MMQKKFRIISHGVFHGQNGINNVKGVLDPLNGPFGRSVDVSLRQFYKGNILFFPFLAKKISHHFASFRMGFFMDNMA